MKFRHALILVLAKILGLRLLYAEAPYGIVHFIDLGTTLKDSRRLVCVEELCS